MKASVHGNDFNLGFGVAIGEITGYHFPGAKTIKRHIFAFFDEFPTLKDAETFVRKKNGKMIGVQDSTKKPVYEEWIVLSFTQINPDKSVIHPQGVYYRYTTQKPKVKM
jgi:hypothetical protein